MVKYIVDFTIYFSAFLAVLYLIGFLNKKKPYQVFTLYLVAIGIVQIFSEYLIKSGSDSNLHLFHYYFVSQFILLSLFYYYLIKKKWIIWVLLAVIGLLTYQYFDNPSLYFQYNAIGLAVTQIVLVLYTIIHLYNSLSQKNEFVIITTGLLIYLLSSIIIFASGNLVFDLNISKAVSRLLNDLNAILYLVFQIMVLIEWFQNYRKKVTVN